VHLNIPFDAEGAASASVDGYSAALNGAPFAVALWASLTTCTLVGNGIICGALSNPHDRYQSRLVPVAPLAVAITALGYRRRGARVPDI
jgi:hypothetical protein